MSELYKRIDQLSKARGINITALCKAAKVARSSLSELHMGRTKTLTLETAQKLAAVLEVSVDELLGSEHEKTRTLEGGRENTVVLYGRDGKNKIIHYTPAQMRRVEAILDALQSDDVEF